MRQVGDMFIGEAAPDWFTISRRQQRGDEVTAYEFLHLVRPAPGKEIPPKAVVDVGSPYAYVWRGFPDILYGNDQVDLALERLNKHGAVPIDVVGRDYSLDDEAEIAAAPWTGSSGPPAKNQRGPETLRDYFAGQAVQGVAIVMHTDAAEMDAESAKAISRMSYQVADAMLATRTLVLLLMLAVLAPGAARAEVPPGVCREQRVQLRQATVALGACFHAGSPASAPVRCTNLYRARRRAVVEQEIACPRACDLDAWQAATDEARLSTGADPEIRESQYTDAQWANITAGPRAAEALDCAAWPLDARPPSEPQAAVMRADARPAAGAACVELDGARWRTGHYRRGEPPGVTETWEAWWAWEHGTLNPRWWWLVTFEAFGWSCVSP
jgi:hypothetical protein